MRLYPAYLYLGLASAGVPRITQRWKRPETGRDGERWLQMVKGGRRQPEMARDGLRWLEMAPGVVESVLPAAREQAFMQSHRYREMSRDGQSRRRAYGHQRLRGARAL